MIIAKDCYVPVSSPAIEQVLINLFLSPHVTAHLYEVIIYIFQQFMLTS